MKFILRNVLLPISAAIFFFVFLEGICSTWIGFRSIISNWQSALPLEAQHSSYDPLLGWIGKPGFDSKHFYGTNGELTINSQGYRANSNYDLAVNTQRVVCTGDSFTFGFGVGNVNVWCQQLMNILGFSQNINIAYGGYGIDQAYLRYKREINFQHTLAIFGIITDDFNRMQRDEFIGFPKPMLMLHNDALTVINTPIQKFSYILPSLARNLQNFNQLRTLQLGNQLIKNSDSNKPHFNNDNLDEIVKLVFKNFALQAKQYGADPIIVYLPEINYFDKNLAEKFQAMLDLDSKINRYRFVNLFKIFYETIQERDRSEFFDNGAYYPHLNSKGNLWVATSLNEILKVEQR